MDSLTEPHIITQGGVFKYRAPAGPGRRKGGGTRRAITIFSDRSRRALMERFASTDWQALMERGCPILFLTLTLTPEYWSQLRVCKKGVAAVERWIGGLDGFEGGVVRREYGEKRGALHYHLIILGVSRIDAGELRRRWSQAVRYVSALDKPEYLRVQVEPVESVDRVAKYLSKYVSKAAWEGAIRAGEACASVASAGPSDAESAVTLSKAQIATEEAVDVLADSHTGTRYWSFFGPWPFAEAQVLPLPESIEGRTEADRVRKYAARVRRIFRKWRVSLERVRLQKNAVPIGAWGGVEWGRGGEMVSLSQAQVRARAADVRGREVKIFERSKLGWLKSSGGFSLFIAPTLMTKIIQNARDSAGWFVDVNNNEGVVGWA